METLTPSPTLDLGTLSLKDREALAAMAKALPKDSPRNYADKIGIQNGAAYVTDGFYLVEYLFAAQSLPLKAVDACLDRNFFPSAIKYPRCTGIFDRGDLRELESLCAADLLSLVDALGAKETKGVYLAVDRNGKSWLASGGVKGLGLDTLAFNPWLIKRGLKSLPKGIRPNSVSIGKDSLIVTAGDFRILLLSLSEEKGA